MALPPGYPARSPELAYRERVAPEIRGTNIRNSQLDQLGSTPVGPVSSGQPAVDPNSLDARLASILKPRHQTGLDKLFQFLGDYSAGVGQYAGNPNLSSFQQIGLGMGGIAPAQRARAAQKRSEQVGNVGLLMQMEKLKNDQAAAQAAQTRANAPSTEIGQANQEYQKGQISFQQWAAITGELFEEDKSDYIQAMVDGEPTWIHVSEAEGATPVPSDYATKPNPKNISYPKGVEGPSVVDMNDYDAFRRVQELGGHIVGMEATDTAANYGLRTPSQKGKGADELADFGKNLTELDSAFTAFNAAEPGSATGVPGYLLEKLGGFAGQLDTLFGSNFKSRFGRPEERQAALDARSRAKAVVGNMLVEISENGRYTQKVKEEAKELNAELLLSSDDEAVINAYKTVISVQQGGAATKLLSIMAEQGQPFSELRGLDLSMDLKGNYTNPKDAGIFNKRMAATEALALDQGVPADMMNEIFRLMLKNIGLNPYG